MRPVFLLIESNTTGTGPFFAEAARSMGFTPWFLVADASRYPFLQNADVEVTCVETANFDVLCGAVEKIRSANRIAGVTTSSDYWLSTTAQLALRLGLPGASPQSLRNCRNKNWQRSQLGSAGLPMPQHRGASSMEELDVAVSGIVPPYVVKPACGTGSVGVRLCRTPEDAITHGQALLAQTVNERGMNVRPEVAVESYIEGPEYSAEMFGFELIGVTRKHLSSEPYFVETGHDYPAALNAASLQSIEQMCQTALRALGLGWGPAHVEFRMTVDGPFVIEINPRLAGGFIPSLVRLSTGIDLILQTVALCAGYSHDLSGTCERAASIRFITYPNSGMFLGLDGAALMSASGIADFCNYYPGPRSISIHHDFRDRVGHVITLGDNVAVASAAADEALQHVFVLMDAEDSEVKR